MDAAGKLVVGIGGAGEVACVEIDPLFLIIRMNEFSDFTVRGGDRTQALSGISIIAEQSSQIVPLALPNQGFPVLRQVVAGAVITEPVQLPVGADVEEGIRRFGEDLPDCSVRMDDNKRCGFISAAHLRHIESAAVFHPFGEGEVISEHGPTCRLGIKIQFSRFACLGIKQIEIGKGDMLIFREGAFIGVQFRTDAVGSLLVVGADQIEVLYLPLIQLIGEKVSGVRGP